MSRDNQIVGAAGEGESRVNLPDPQRPQSDDGTPALGGELPAGAMVRIAALPPEQRGAALVAEHLAMVTAAIGAIDRAAAELQAVTRAAAHERLRSEIAIMLATIERRCIQTGLEPRFRAFEKEVRAALAIPDLEPVRLGALFDRIDGEIEALGAAFGSATPDDINSKRMDH